MSLQQRIAKLERALDANELASIAAERDAYRSWFESLSREEKRSFFEFCLPAMVEVRLVPPSETSPFEMSDEERADYVEEVKWLLANRPELTSREDIIADHRFLQDLWRGYLRHHWSRRQAENLEGTAPATPT